MELNRKRGPCPPVSIPFEVISKPYRIQGMWKLSACRPSINSGIVADGQTGDTPSLSKQTSTGGGGGSGVGLR